MEAGTESLFQRVAVKLGWDKPGALDRAEEQLRKSLKSRRPAVASPSVLGRDSLRKPLLSDSDSSGKENHREKANQQINLDSSDDEFNQSEFFYILLLLCVCFLLLAAVEHVLTRSLVVLSRVKTPKAKLSLQSGSGSEDGLKQFVVDDLSPDDDFVVEKKKPSVIKGKTKTPIPPRSVQKLEKPPPVSEFCSPVFLSDSEDDSDVVIRSTWRTRHSRDASRDASRPSSGKKNISTKELEPRTTSRFPSPLTPVLTLTPSSAPPTRSGWRDDSASSEDEFQSLLDRIRKNQKSGSSSTNASPRPPAGKISPARIKTAALWGYESSSCLITPAQLPVSRTISQTEPRGAALSRVAVCKTPGCFLQSLSLPGSSFCRDFKQKKEDLTKKLYQLYNSSVFDSKLPTDMSVTWNTKLRKTAGYCITGQERVTSKRYARIELSVKVCDSADRLRDTLVHEMCHAATWLINNVRDGHGPFWKIYARKATLAHPELPMVTRCHSYDINYKYQYQCSRCKNTIGRHSKSLDTERFVCALCTGKLVLLTPANSRGPTPFATFVKENYGPVRQELAGQSHAEVMRKLSADFSKTRLSQS
uniref:Germ cell nuclear acidic peptidase n=1 Tax=Astyanax mexicanus TaxID=7994 RepID=W5L4R5_ASTMX